MCKCQDDACGCESKQPNPHKHAALIKAWADGATIEMHNPKYPRNGWCPVPEPRWNVDCEYRIKPEPEPDVVRYVVLRRNYGFRSRKEAEMVKNTLPDSEIQVATFDGETGKLKDVCLIK